MKTFTKGNLNVMLANLKTKQDPAEIAALEKKLKSGGKA